MTSDQALSLPDGPYVLSDLTLPAAFCAADLLCDTSGMGQREIGIKDGKFTAPMADWPRVDARGLMALPPFTDAHVHLDKAYTIQRSGLGDGSLLGAIRVMARDSERWTADDLRARMMRGAKQALAHGTRLMRTHLDTIELPDETDSWDILADVQNTLAGAMTIQPVSLCAVERAQQDNFEQRCQQIKRRGGVLGAFIAPGPVPTEAIRALLAGAARHGLDVDFHNDEDLLPGPPALATIAEVMIETGHQTRVTAGHCCKLSLFSGDDLSRILERVAKAGIHIIALPTTNLFLQDRGAQISPRRRGIAPLREMQAHGIAISTASDNIQDAFYPFGDFDILELLRGMIVAGHMDQDIDSAIALGITGGAQAMGHGAPRIALGQSADFTLFRGTNWFDLLAHPQSERMVLRSGRAIETTPFLTGGPA